MFYQALGIYWSLLALLCAGSLHAAPLEWPISSELLEQTRDEIQRLAASSDIPAIEEVRLVRPIQVSRYYQERDFMPIWVEKEGVLVEAAELLAVLKRSDTEGLLLQDYPITQLENYLFGAIDGPTQLAQLELLLTDAFLNYSRNVRSGRFGPRRYGQEWLLPYRSYDGSALLTQALSQHTLSKAIASLPPSHEGYRRLRTLLQHYRTIAAQGGWPSLAPGETLALESHEPRVATLRERLKITGDLYGTSEHPTLFDTTLQEAVQRFQRRHGLLDDGKVGRKTLAALNLPVEMRIAQIETNMERWRWLPVEMPTRYIIVNMAGYELEVIENAHAVMKMRVIVGRDYRQTPVFTSEVTLLVLNPHWYVPPKIFREDILPVLKRNPHRLKELKMTIVNRDLQVDAAPIDWSTVEAGNFPYTLRQEPGPHNALGRIKFQLRDGNGIYLHDTPDRHLFERTSRAFSSGCIRLEHPLELAQYLLADPERWSVIQLEEAIERGVPLGVTLPEPVPIYFTYWTTWVDQDGLLQLRDDVYNRDRRLLGLWGENAI